MIPVLELLAAAVAAFYATVWVYTVPVKPQIYLVPRPPLPVVAILVSVVLMALFLESTTGLPYGMGVFVMLLVNLVLFRVVWVVDLIRQHLEDRRRENGEPEDLFE